MQKDIQWLIWYTLCQARKSTGWSIGEIVDKVNDAAKSWQQSPEAYVLSLMRTDIGRTQLKVDEMVL